MLFTFGYPGSFYRVLLGQGFRAQSALTTMLSYHLVPSRPVQLGSKMVAARARKKPPAAKRARLDHQKARPISWDR
jgi:hypothetical protein